MSASSSSRAANTSAILSASRRRATNASARADARSSHCASSTTTKQRPLLGGLRQQAEDRQSDEERIRRLPGAEPERDGERVALRIREALHEFEARRAQLLKRGVGELHLPLDADRAGDPEVAPRLDRVLQQRRLADAGLSVHNATPRRARLARASSSRSTTSRSGSRPRSCSPADRVTVSTRDDAPPISGVRSMPLGSRTKDFGIRTAARDGNDGYP